MELEKLMQAYKINGVNAELKEMNEKKEKAGVILYENGISASYLLDNEDIIIIMKIFFNELTDDKLTLSNQIDYSVNVINIIKQTINLLANVTNEEINMILETLGLFDGTFKKGKQVRHLEFEYKIEIVSGLICFTIQEIVKG